MLVVRVRLLRCGLLQVVSLFLFQAAGRFFLFFFFLSLMIVLLFVLDILRERVFVCETLQFEQRVKLIQGFSLDFP